MRGARLRLVVRLTRPGFLDATTPFAIAHRGGATYAPNAGIENTVQAFRNATAIGHRYLEADVRASRDGVAVVVHDERLDRLCAVPERVAELTWAELSRLRVGGREPLPRLDEVLATFPAARFNIDVKSDDAVLPVLRSVEAADAAARVCLASFFDHRIRRIRRLAGPGVATSCSSVEVGMLRFGPTRWARAVPARRGAVCIQVPLRTRGFTVLTPRLVRDAHESGLQVHVWVVDDLVVMRRLLDLGVDALITDRIDLVGDALRSGHPAP